MGFNPLKDSWRDAVEDAFDGVKDAIHSVGAQIGAAAGFIIAGPLGAVVGGVSRYLLTLKTVKAKKYSWVAQGD